ncbi:uncharacterized protein FMAN_09927 [Fusarium mangiferae]|uniref:Uncharacterized protein n=1 Tax=Fusarium mangiferae TaxID=192010 RepID=A0A1L7U096_FUSMA|nr:uncharacterized protein FMAN_09927 [Fusarium mangiferae]CVL00506.1 uncharacterized protein FMAN_09927 [Fusarium mangiferae]
MDPFNALSPEVQLKILLSIDSASLSSITRASPTMLQRYNHDRAKIEQNLLRLQEDEVHRLQEENASLRREYETLRQTASQIPNLSVPSFEEPAILREEARRLIKESAPCDVATVAKYIRWMPRGARLVCSQGYRVTYTQADHPRLEGMAPRNIEIVIGAYLSARKERGTLDPEEPIDLFFECL